METTTRRLAGAALASEDEGEVSARQLVLERDLVVRALSPLLAQRDLLRLARTNRACLREVRAGLETLSLRSLNVMYHDEVTDVLRLFPSLRSLDLCDNGGVTDATITQLAILHNLRELDICGFRSDVRLVLSEKLESLALGEFSSEASLVATLQSLPNLHTLDLSAANLSDEGLVSIANALVHLRSLELGFNDEFMDAGFIPFTKACSRLECLDLMHCEQITETYIRALAENCPRLKELSLHWCSRITDSAIVALTAGQCPLKEIDLTRTRLTDESVLALNQCRSLESLSLSDCCNVTDASIILFVMGRTALRRLALRDCAISDDSVLAIARNCPMIKDLTLGPTKAENIPTWHITDAALVELAARCVNLERLAIHSPITDLALVPLTRHCSKLRVLSVHSPHVTDQVISNLAGMVDLTLWHNQHVTLDALADLVRRSPDLFLIYIHDSCSIDSHSLFWFLYEEMGPGVLRSHRALKRFLAVRIPKEDLLFPEAGLPEGIYQRIV